MKLTIEKPKKRDQLKAAREGRQEKDSEKIKMKIYIGVAEMGLEKNKSQKKKLNCLIVETVENKENSKKLEVPKWGGKNSEVPKWRWQK